MAERISFERVVEIMKVVLSELKRVGGQARLKELFQRAEAKLDLTSYEEEVYAKSGYVRWRTVATSTQSTALKRDISVRQEGNGT
jgi:hypothetical protein